jgi:hypothetical protein
MKKIYYAIALNMISLALMAQTSTQPAERVETTKPITGDHYGKVEGKIGTTQPELLKPENTPLEEPAQPDSDKPVEASLGDENSQVLAKASHNEAGKSHRTAIGRRPLPFRISIGALMLSANR